ncbi:dynamin family protein [Chlorogloea sp. CCALA 695]|uniref:dynamin family protein n=1 Tax=Chlorogloea sp. CCALA 695 TaxID=2107693 RepID=UPI000D06F219|nr:dynamin family protein [Chlorogloea sp. CCALA 695]PSB31281.1 dynamin [Chlorogloea sp. CCALA 695]
MSAKIAPTNFINDLDRVSQSRLQVSQSLYAIAQTLEKAELEGEKQSGKLELSRDIEDIAKASIALRNGVFRLLVLGDMKRGKSTFLNALIGENLLPSDVNPCTAILTILRYGLEKKVTVHFNNGTSPENLDFKTFKQRYTIDGSEAKELEQQKKLAFPEVSHAVVEYPLSLLEKGVEIIDSPGLNDTEARNELSLGYVNNCHAILFVMRASQPCTLGERRYLENYIKSRGLTVFFLINAWDQVKESLIDPDDKEELAESEEKLRRVFKANLAEYCQIDGYDVYDERVFEVSSIQALRRRLKNPDASLEGTGFTEFMSAISTFLTKERAVSELRQARTLARLAYQHVNEAIERRVPLLEQDIEELKRRIDSVEPEFDKLTDISNQFQTEIRTVKQQKAREVADAFRTYVLNLGDTFESDFLRYQPELKFMDFLDRGKREAFEMALKQAFEKYLHDKLAAFSVIGEQQMNAAFGQLSQSAAHYGASYSKVTDKITEKLTGQKVQIGSAATEDNSPSWAKWAMGLISLASGNVAGVALAGVGMDWKNIMLNLVAVIGIGGAIATFSGIILGPISLALLALGIGAMQADSARQQLVKATKKELIKYLPQVAQEQWQPVYDAVQECFEAYETEVNARINDDIKARKSELENLSVQKASHEIDRVAELARLRMLENNISDEVKSVESAYQHLLSA